MAIYSISQIGTVTTSGSAAFDVACGAGVRARVMEFGAFLGAATASTYGLARTTALGTRTTPTALLNEDPADAASECDSAIAWSVQPTIAATDLRKIALPATIGTGVIWTFPKGLVIASSLSLALVNRAINSASTPAYVVVDE